MKFDFKTILFISCFISTFASASVLEKLYSDSAIYEYTKDLLSKVQSGGVLYCEENSIGKKIEFKSCESFTALKKKGCFGNSTYAMSVESRYSMVCGEINTIKQASSSKINYFELESSDWWKSIPAEVIPMSGGIYSDESWNLAKLERDKLVAGKVLGDLKLVNLSRESGVLNINLSKSTQECGLVYDTFKLSAKLLADFDQDGINELLLKGYRVDNSDSCSLGSGNSLGAGFIVLLKKESISAAPIVLAYPLLEK